MTRGMKKGNNRIKKSVAVFLVGITALIGSLILCGPFSENRKEETTELFSEKIENNSQPVKSEYNAGDVAFVPKVYDASLLDVTAKTDNKDYGDVEYVKSYTEKGQSITATALPKDGYKLDHWEVANEVVKSLGENTEVTITDISEDMALNAVFTSDEVDGIDPSDEGSDSSMEKQELLGAEPKYRIKTVIDPGCIPEDKTAADVGTVSGGAQSDKPLQVQIGATANTGFRFDHWHINIQYQEKGKGWLNYQDYNVESNPYTIYTYVPVSDDKLSGYEANCKAWFVPIEPKASVVSITPFADGATVANGNIEIGSTPTAIDKNSTITATAKDGYFLTKLYYTTKNGVLHNYSPSDTDKKHITVPVSDVAAINEDVFLHVECTKDDYLVTCIDDPMSGGDSEISYEDASGTTQKAKEQLRVPSGTDVTITADPFSGYIFDGFYSSTGTKFDDSTYVVLHDVSRDQTITAKYIKENINVTIEPSPGLIGGGGSVQYNNEPATDVKRTYVYHPGTESNFVLTAEANTSGGYTFKYWQDDKGTMYNTNPLTISGLKEDRSYVAVYTKQNQEFSVVIEPSPAEGGTVEFNDEGKISERGFYFYDTRSESGFTLTAKAKPGYTFQYWIDDLGTMYNKEVIRITKIEDDRLYTALFASDNNIYTVSAVADPVTGGVMEISYEDDEGKEIKAGGQLRIPEGKDVNITATAEAGYIFDSFIMPTGTRVPGTEQTDGSFLLTITNLSRDQAITARFIKENIDVTIVPSPYEGGTVQYNDNEPVSEAETYHYSNEEIGFTITAKADPGYTFQYWIDDKGTMYNKEVTRITDLVEDRLYTAVFAKDNIVYTVSAVADPVDGGITEISYKDDDGQEIKGSGQLKIPKGKDVNIFASSSEGYTFDNFIMPTGTKTKGTKQADGSYLLTITDLSSDQAIIASFVKESVNITIIPSPSEGGTVQYNDEKPVSSEETYLYSSKSESGFTLTAKAKTGYTFQYWIDNNGNSYKQSIVRLTKVTGDTTFTAFFMDNEEAEKKGLRVVSSPPSGGHVRKKRSGNRFKITAYPNDGWVFVGWMKDRENKYVSKSKTYKVDDEDVTYIGCFEKMADYKPTTDIIYEDFYNEKRKFTEPDYSVSRQTIESLAATAISYDKLRYADNLPDVHAYGAVATAAEYYNEKLDPSHAITVKGILITTDNEVIGTTDISDMELIKDTANDITFTKFGERYDSRIIAAVYTQPPKGFDGLVRTYLWKETGAKHGDNVYVMYRDKGSDINEMAAVVDEDGIVRFTLEDALIGTEFALVKVTISDNASKLRMEEDDD